MPQFNYCACVDILAPPTTTIQVQGGVSTHSNKQMLETGEVSAGSMNFDKYGFLISREDQDGLESRSHDYRFDYVIVSSDHAHVVVGTPDFQYDIKLSRQYRLSKVTDIDIINLQSSTFPCPMQCSTKCHNC